MPTSRDDDDYDVVDAGDDRPGLEDADDLEELDTATEVDDDDDDLDDEDDDDDDYDDLDDAEDDEIDLVVALYREDGQPVGQTLPKDVANDLDELITQLRRMPGDAGALGLVSIDEEFVVLARVRGRHVQVLLNDAVAANDWPIARDVAEFLGAEIPDGDDDPSPLGDMGMCTDLGISEFDLEAIVTNYDDPSDEIAMTIAERLKMGTQFRKALESTTHR